MRVAQERGLILLDRLNHSRSAKAVAFWTLYAIVTILAAAIYIRIVPSSDQSIFDYLAWLNIHGVPYYEGSFDMTWPGQLVFHELAIRIFGVHPWTTRAGDFLFLQPAILAIYVFLRRAGLPGAAVCAALTYPIIYVTSGAWVSGHRDMTGMHFLIGAAIFALPGRKRSPLAAIFSGLLIGYATMIRPTYLAFVPMLFVVAIPTWKGDGPWTKESLKQALLLGSGIAVAPLAFLLYGLATGTLYDWYVDSVRYIAEVYPSWTVDQSRWRLFTMAGNFIRLSLRWLVLAGAGGGLLWFFYGRNRQALGLLAGMVATVLISFFVQNKGFAAHLAGLIPVLLLLGWAGAAAAFVHPIGSRQLQNGLAALLAVLLIAGTGSRVIGAIPRAPDWGRQEQSNPLKLADVIYFAGIMKSESSPSDTMLQWSREYQEYQVSFLSERRPPSKFFNVTGEQLIKPGQPLFGQWLEQFQRDLDSQPPKFVLVDDSIIPPGTGLPAQGKANTAVDQIFKRRINRGYDIHDRRGNWTLLERTGGGS